MDNYFKSGTVSIGGKDVLFEKRGIRGGFSMYIPTSFAEDKTLVSNYSYLFDKDKSPLSIAVKFSPLMKAIDRDRMIDKYFGGSNETKPTEVAGHGILYRETVIKSDYTSVYSLRFSVDVDDGLLFGCFNCSADYREDWKPVVLEMLKNIVAA